MGPGPVAAARKQSRNLYLGITVISAIGIKARKREKMEALMASYGDHSSDSDSHSDPPRPPPPKRRNNQSSVGPPPPPSALLDPPTSSTTLPPLAPYTRVRTFPHVDGNYALHVYIPIHLPPTLKHHLSPFLKKIASLLPLHAIDPDIPLSTLSNDDNKLEHIALGREFHVSLGRTVPIRVHQIGSTVNMLRQRLQHQKPYWIDFSKWEVFVNDDHTRTFLSIEVISGGLAEIAKQIQAVNEVYRLHNLPEFYENPRPHISVAWASGDVSDALKRLVGEELRRCNVKGLVQNRIFSTKFSGILCKIGKKTHNICKVSDEF